MKDEFALRIDEIMMRIDSGDRLGFYECERFIELIPAFTESVNSLSSS